MSERTVLKYLLTIALAEVRQREKAQSLGFLVAKGACKVWKVSYVSLFVPVGLGRLLTMLAQWASAWEIRRQWSSAVFSKLAKRLRRSRWKDKRNATISESRSLNSAPSMSSAGDTKTIFFERGALTLGPIGHGDL